MVANVEAMAFVGAIPWHGLGVQVDSGEADNVDDFIVKAGLDWEVGVKPLFTQDDEPVPAKATYRKTDNKILGVVGPRYTPLQNRVAFDWFQPFIDAKECLLHTAGSLCEGQKVWVLAQLNRDNSEIVKGDEVAKFILLSNSHDGTTAIRVGYTPIRVVCANTLAMAHGNSGSKLIRIRHTVSAKVSLEKIRDVMDNINAEFEATAEQYRFLCSKQFNQNDVRKYVKVMLGIENVKTEDMKTRTKNTLAEVLRFIDSAHQRLPGVNGSWYSAYNGYNEYLNYAQGRNSNNRMNSLWFGANANENVKALEKAIEFANAV